MTVAVNIEKLLKRDRKLVVALKAMKRETECLAVMTRVKTLEEELAASKG